MKVILKCQHCSKPFLAHHYRRETAKYCSTGCYRGSPGPIRQTADERFWSKVIKHEGGCWLWQSATRYGYGVFSLGRRSGKRIMAHRYSYLTLVGEIPNGLQLDHLCRVRNCVNPAHLEPVTPKENVLRGEGPSALQSRRMDCIHGHPLSGDNLYITPKGKRRCKTCRSEAMKRLSATGYFKGRTSGMPSGLER